MADTGPPAKKRFVNGGEGGSGETSSPGQRGSFSRGRGGRGFRGGGGGGGRGGFRGRGGRDFGGRGGRGSPGGFRGRGGSPGGFRGRGGSPGGFRGRGGSPGGFRGRGGSPSGFRGRGAPFSPGFRGRGGPAHHGHGGFNPSFPADQFLSENGDNVLTVFNLPKGEGYKEQREVLKTLLSKFEPNRVDFSGMEEGKLTKATVGLRDGKMVIQACSELNGATVEGRRIILAGSRKNLPDCQIVAITNLPDPPSLTDLLDVLCSCKSIARIFPFNVKASPPYLLISVSSEEDVKTLLAKSSTVIKGSTIVNKVLSSTCMARSSTPRSYENWKECFGDVSFYINIALDSTEIFFETANDLNTAFSKIDAINEKEEKKINLERVIRYTDYYVQVTGATGEVDDIGLYTKFRSFGEIIEFTRLDKANYRIKQEASVAESALKVSGSKGGDGELTVSRNDLRSLKKATTQNQDTPKKKTPKKKTPKKKKKASGNLNTENSDIAANILKKGDKAESQSGALGVEVADEVNGDGEEKLEDAPEAEKDVVRQNKQDEENQSNDDITEQEGDHIAEEDEGTEEVEAPVVPVKTAKRTAKNARLKRGAWRGQKRKRSA